MFHRRAPRHGTAHTLRCFWFRRSPRPVHACVCGAELPIEEPVRPLGAGHMDRRPGGMTYEVRLGPVPGPALSAFRNGLAVKTTADAEGIEAGVCGFVSRVAAFRKSKPIGVRMAGAWGPLMWFDLDEIVPDSRVVDDAVVFAAEGVLDDTRELHIERVEGAWIGFASAMDDTRELDELPLMGGAR